MRSTSLLYKILLTNLGVCKPTFCTFYTSENAYKSIFDPLGFIIFWGGAYPQTPLKARAFGAPILPRLVLKSGYGPVKSYKRE